MALAVRSLVEECPKYRRSFLYTLELSGVGMGSSELAIFGRSLLSRYNVLTQFQTSGICLSYSSSNFTRSYDHSYSESRQGYNGIINVVEIKQYQLDICQNWCIELVNRTGAELVHSQQVNAVKCDLTFKLGNKR